MTPQTTHAPRGDIAATLLGLVEKLAAELHPRRAARRTVTLDSALERDLGLDSLARMELLDRIERQLGVAFPERLFAEAVTPRDLLRAMSHAMPRETSRAAPTIVPAARAADLAEPRDASTLVGALSWHARRDPRQVAIRLYDEQDDLTDLTYGELMDRAVAVAGGLRRRGLQPGEAVAIMLPTCPEYFPCLFGIMLAGGTAVPIYPPWRIAQLEDYFRRHRGILDNCRAAMLITFEQAARVAKLLESQVETLRAVVQARELTAGRDTGDTPAVAGDHVALLQYTSGSTGNPKGVVLTHANLLANIRSMGESAEVRPDDVLVSWLPLYHDMGLIGAVLGTVYFGIPLVVMAPQSFLARPVRWLRAIHRHRATISAAPNFAYEICLRRIADDDMEHLELDCWRIAMNGAEPVSDVTLERFHQRFKSYGLRREALMPVYGLAECSVGLAFPPVGRGPRIDRIEREAFMRSGRAVPAAEAAAEALRFVSCGHPVAGHEIRVVDPTGRELPERREGALQFRGPSTTSGYFRNPEHTRKLFDGDWLNSGDLAYLADGEVYITGRTKDIIIRAGRNLYPEELERAVGELEGVRKGCVAVFGSPGAETGTERLVVMAETREQHDDARQELTGRINETVAQLVQAPPDDVVLVPPHTVAKTSSGKIRRAASRERYLRGLDRPQRSVRWQVIRLMVASAGPLVRRLRRVAADWLYGVYFWSLFAVMAPAVWLLVVGLPRPAWRFGVGRRAVRFFARAVGTPLSVQGLEYLAPLGGRCVLVANHASYIDGAVLVGALPVALSFIAKGELAANPLARAPLRRLGAEFVERIDRQRSVEDARHVADGVRAGRTFLFFAEGTFERMPGLLPFRMGAFVVAAEAGVPVVPVAIRGTRSILRAYSWLPRRGPIRVTVGRPIGPAEVDAPAADSWAVALKLRQATREQILRYCGEPDLGSQLPPGLPDAGAPETRTTGDD